MRARLADTEHGNRWSARVRSCIASIRSRLAALLQQQLAGSDGLMEAPSFGKPSVGSYRLRVMMQRPNFGQIRGHSSIGQKLHVRIPLKWGPDSGKVGQRRSEATLVMPIMSEVPQLSQEISD
jgi:hypothetical protein